MNFLLLIADKLKREAAKNDINVENCFEIS